MIVATTKVKNVKHPSPTIGELERWRLVQTSTDLGDITVFVLRAITVVFDGENGGMQHVCLMYV